MPSCDYMFADRVERLVSFHDTWISLDPLRGCPYRCVYCVLRHGGGTGVLPRTIASPKECIEALLEYRLFVRGHTPVAIGNETDIFHPRNRGYLVELLTEMSGARIENPIVLVTKAPLSDKIMAQIKAIPGIRVVLFLSYSGLGRDFEPNFTDEQLRLNFRIAKANGLPVVHYWRPLLPPNTTSAAVRSMLSFVSSIADATVFVGLKLHPELTEIITQGDILTVPGELRDQTGEWLGAEAVTEFIMRQVKSVRIMVVVPFDFICGAPESHHAYVHAAVHPSDERFQ